MKLITSLVRPERLDVVTRGLSSLNVCAVRVMEVRDHSPQKHQTAVWMGREYDVGSSLKMEIQVVVYDDDVDRVVDLIIDRARTGTPGDGHVRVMSIDHGYDIRTGRPDVS